MRTDLAEAFRLFLTDLGYDRRAKDDVQGKEDDLQRASDFLLGHLRRGDLPAVAHEYFEEHIDECGAHFLMSVNRQRIGTPYRHPKGTPFGGESGR